MKLVAAGKPEHTGPVCGPPHGIRYKMQPPVCSAGRVWWTPEVQVVECSSAGTALPQPVGGTPCRNLANPVPHGVKPL